MASRMTANDVLEELERVRHALEVLGKQFPDYEVVLVRKPSQAAAVVLPEVQNEPVLIEIARSNE